MKRLRPSSKTLRKRADTLVGQRVTLYSGEVVTLYPAKISAAGHLVLVQRADGRIERVSVTAIINLNPSSYTPAAQAKMAANGQTGWPTLSTETR